MPKKASAKKAHRQSVKRNELNSAKAKVLKHVIKECRKSADSGSAEKTECLSKAYKALDKAAKTNLIKKNKASRLKSRLSKAVNKPVK